MICFLRINCLQYIFTRGLNTFSPAHPIGIFVYDTRTLTPNCGLNQPAAVATAINATRNSIQASLNMAGNNDPFRGLNFANISRRINGTLPARMERQFAIAVTNGNCTLGTGPSNGSGFYAVGNASTSTCIALPPASSLVFSLQNYPQI